MSDLQLAKDISDILKKVTDKLEPITVEKVVTVEVEKVVTVEKPVEVIKTVLRERTPAEILEEKRQRVVDVAMSLKGKVSYVHYSERQEAVPPFKTDCSGFTYLAYKMSGTIIPWPSMTSFNRDDDSQAKVGTEVAWGKFEKGDIICISNSNSTSPTDTGHVGIYIGGGKVIHNASATVDVTVSDVETWKAKFITARRLLK